MAITDWPVDERPREKLPGKTPAALSDAELLAIFLTTGLSGKSTVNLARDLLKHFGSLTAVCTVTDVELCAVPGIGQAKFVQFKAVMEMARRALKEKMIRGDALSSPAVVRRVSAPAVTGFAA